MLDLRPCADSQIATQTTLYNLLVRLLERGGWRLDTISKPGASTSDETLWLPNEKSNSKFAKDFVTATDFAP